MQKTDKNIVIIVQARSSSTRLPGKVLLPILEKSLLFRMIERLKLSKYLAKIIIATSIQAEDDCIENESNMLGLPCFRGSLTNLLDRHYQAALKYNADVVVKIPSDCPLIDPKIIDKVFDFYFENEGKFDFVSNLHPTSFPDGNDVEIMTFNCLKTTWLNASQPFELEHTTPYIWENPNLFSIGNYNAKNHPDLSMLYRFTIDYQEDYLFIKKVYEELYPKNRAFTFEDIIKLLDEKPYVFEINAKYAGVNWYRNHLKDLKTIDKSQTRFAPVN